MRKVYADLCTNYFTFAGETLWEPDCFEHDLLHLNKDEGNYHMQNKLLMNRVYPSVYVPAFDKAEMCTQKKPEKYGVTCSYWQNI